MYNKELTQKMLGDIGPLRFNPYVIKVCCQCTTPNKVRYKGAGKPSAPYYCSKCIANRPEKKAKSKAGAIKAWQNPDYRQQITNNSIQIWKDNDRADRMSTFRHSAEFKDVMAKINTNPSHYDHGFREKHAELGRTRWADKEYRKKIIMVLRNNWARIKSNPERYRAYRDKLRNSTIKLWNDPAYRAKITHVLQQSRANMPRISSLQNTLYSILDDLGVKYYKERPDGPADSECIIGPYSFDCVIPRAGDSTLLIECQGEYWHKLKDATSRDNAKASYINNHFPDQYEIKYLWEIEFRKPNRVMTLLKHWLGIEPIQKIQFELDTILLKSCNIDDYRELLAKYHYLPSVGRGGIAIGAYINDIIIAVAVFSPLIRQNISVDGYEKRNICELSRLCIHPQYQQPNLGSWFLSRAIRRLPDNIECILTYADTTFGHSGTIYLASNFIMDKKVPPDYWYVGQDGWVMHKRTLYEHARHMHSTEATYATANGYRKVWGAEKLRFIYKR